MAALTGLSLVALYLILDQLLEKLIEAIDDFYWLDKITYYPNE